MKQLIAGIDCFLLLLSFYIANIIIFGKEFNFTKLFDYWMMLIGFMGFYLYFAWTRSLFSILNFNWMYGLFRRVGTIFVSAGMLGAAILYLAPRDQSSRYLYIAFAGISFVLIIAEKLIIKQFIAALRRNNRNITPMIIVGRGRSASQVYQEIICHPEWGLRVTRKLDLSITPAEFEEVLKNSYTEEVCFCIPRKITNENFSIDPYLRICEEMGRSARVFLNLSGATSFARWEYHRFMDRATLISHTVELDPDQVIFKRIFDILGGLVGLAILIALYPFLAVAIKLTSRGPILFRQVRVGKNGKRFVIYKFRSMFMNAEERKKELMVKNELKGAVFKMKNDPRVTLIGRFMRKFSLDEFPQMVNVLKGEMSLVGTRPPTPDEVANYQKWHHRRISIRPGLTGLWQVSGRNRITTFDDIVKLDLTYIDNWSIWLDLKIILKTFIVLFQRDTAY
ncbi:MAG: sugar transferase [Chitinispirillaceae bacterium]|nr:sugar transferase [Chitinispirillaceae bacterium]